MNMLELKGIHYSAEDKNILKGVSIAVKKGSITALIGANGTGKTTIVSIIMGVKKPDKGKIFLNGKDITNKTITQRALMGLGVAWQNPAYFEGLSIRDYLSINSKESPEKALKAVGLGPEFLNRNVDDHLSGGERKRVELASLLATRPLVAVLDEPDSGIDMASLSVVKSVISGLRKEGSTVLLITHNEKIAEISDEVYMMYGGRTIKKEKEKIIDFFRKYCKTCTHVGEIKEERMNELS